LGHGLTNILNDQCGESEKGEFKPILMPGKKYETKQHKTAEINNLEMSCIVEKMHKI
jgi:hypothetical protein